jgi:polygalacturonase
VNDFKVITMQAIIKLIIFFTFVSCNAQNGTYYITDAGTKCDGKTNNTEAINKTIRRCNRNDSGALIASPGEFISLNIQILSNENLEIILGEVINGSLDTADYRIEGRKHELVFAEDVQSLLSDNPINKGSLINI